MIYKHIQLPLCEDDALSLQAGQACYLSGTMFLLRDAGHKKLLDELASKGELPYNLKGHTIFYAGPSPSKGTQPFGAVGPTTSSRMDFAAAKLYDAGIVASVGKGYRSCDVVNACKNNRAVYFVACGGAAAYLAQCIVSSEVVAYEELGTEALRKVEVRDLPVFVGIDTNGGDIYATNCEVSKLSIPANSPDARAFKRDASFLSGSDGCNIKTQGYFLTFEGGEGSGKSTHSKLLVSMLTQLGYKTQFFREPGSTTNGEALRDILLDSKNTNLSKEAELLIYEAARAQLVFEKIIPALQNAEVVICDRYYDSTLAYQVFARGLNFEFCQLANDFATMGIHPDKTILLSIEGGVETGLIRATSKSAADRIEMEDFSFHNKVKEGFEQIANNCTERICKLKVQDTKAETSYSIFKQLSSVFTEFEKLSLNDFEYIYSCSDRELAIENIVNRLRN